MYLGTITLPPDWDEEKDCRYFLERWAPDPSYTQSLWEWMRFHYRDYARAINAALRCSRSCDAALTHIEPMCLTPVEKIRIVLDSVRGKPQLFTDPARLIEDLQACEVVEGERARILDEYRRAGDSAWMYPVIELIDYLGAAAAELGETVERENEAKRGAHGQKS